MPARQKQNPKKSPPLHITHFTAPPARRLGGLVQIVFWMKSVRALGAALAGT